MLAHIMLAHVLLAPCRCMGERAEAMQQECEAELDSIAARLCTALATMHDYPVIRFRVGKQAEPGDAPGALARSSLSQRLAQKVSFIQECMGTGLAKGHVHSLVATGQKATGGRRYTLVRALVRSGWHKR